jgi:Protein of unknown function (DUF1272)
MALEMRRHYERCQAKLPPDSAEAYICSYGYTAIRLGMGSPRMLTRNGLDWAVQTGRRRSHGAPGPLGLHRRRGRGAR